ncbi:MAG: alpha-L-rhamnosidase C-terminal domain-containing protein [Bacteroidia bacterium]
MVISEDKPIDHHYPISSADSMLFGMTTPEQDAQIMQLMPTQLADIGEVDRRRLSTPYGGFYLLLALAQVEKPEVAEAFIRKYWSPMILRHDDTAWENFGDNGIGTLSHAWSGGPTYYLTSQVLGIDLGWPGPSDPDKVVISPLAETIDWARGKVPHPKGVIEISWEVNGGTLFLNYDGPEGIEFEVKPRGRLAALDLWVNGEPLH